MSKAFRFHPVLLVGITLFGSWLWMQAVHELGHVIAAVATGGTVVRVALPVFGFSRTEVSPNPQPLWVVWGGPILGVMVPLAIWALAARRRVRAVYLARFFAGFCLVANGAYLLMGAFEGGGDPGDLLRMGAPVWLLVAYGLVAVTLGLFLWHREGRHFGLGTDDAEVSVRDAVVLAILTIGWLAFSLMFFR